MMAKLPVGIQLYNLRDIGSLTLNHSKQFTNVASMPHFLMEILSNILHLYIVLCSII